MIESIEEIDDTIYIKTKKNIVLEHQGHIVTINQGYHIISSKEIHLNPNISLEKDLSNIESEMDKIKRIEYEK